MAYHIGFRLADDRDAEERLEGAALWKAMHDHHGPDRISPLLSSDVAPHDWVLFGRQAGRFQSGQEPVSSDLPYWHDEAFIANSGRSFELVSYDALPEAVERLHVRGKAAFLKSTRSKHFTMRIPVGEDVWNALGDMAYSFMDGGPQIMVQEFVDMTYEHRFFVVARRVVTSSPVMVSLTPLDHPLPEGAGFRHPLAADMDIDERRLDRLRALAVRVAEAMEPEHAVVDVAMVDGLPVVIEMNPMVLGQVGLFASSVRALAAASDDLLLGFVPSPASSIPANEMAAEGHAEEWSDAAP